MKHYCFVLLPEYSNLCLFNALEPLRAANSFIQGAGYRWTLASIDGQPVISSSGFEIQPHCSVEALLERDKPDALFVLTSYNYQRHTTSDVLSMLRQARQRVSLIGGLDAGGYALAKAGLLDGYRATIHWAELETFNEQFHRVKALRNRYVIDGKRITAGGATTALDLMIEIIRRDFGAEVAIAVSDLLIFDTERAENTPQRAQVPGRIEQTAPRLARAIRLMEQHIETPLPVTRIARNIGVSQRQLERDFHKTLGTTATRYYARLRILQAQRLLTETSLSVTEIALRAGFNCRTSFARAYKRTFDRSPSHERKQGSHSARDPLSRYATMTDDSFNVLTIRC